MRQFILYNSKGESCNLGDTKHLLYNPDGLGFSFEREYELVGYQFNMFKESIDQSLPTGVIKFDTYEAYHAFALFIQNRPLTLEYIPDDGFAFRISVNVKSFGKSEKESMGWLNSPIVFESLGQWYRYIVMNSGGYAGTGKVYDYTYSYTYEDNAVGSLSCTLESQIESPCKLTFIGPVKNPSWGHYVNGELSAQGRVLCNIPQGHRLVVSSVVPYVIDETDNIGNEIADHYGNSDFSTERFIFLRQGENIISFTHELDNDLNVVVEAYEYFETV